MDELRITLVQTDLYWENRYANLESFAELLKPYEGKTDLVLLPEMFTTGFTLAGGDFVESMNGVSVVWLKEMAEKLGSAIGGSLIIREGQCVYNRFIWCSPDGELHVYDKKHLFRYAGENGAYTAGSEKTVIDYKGWKMRPFICYDLRFPLWSANVQKEYDLGMYVANWPKSRVYHWDTLLQARAIENQVYIVGVNRTGKDGNGIDYSGQSVFVDPRGEVLHRCGEQPETVTVTASRNALEEYRQSFPAWKDM